jgi:hypothetical protein
MSCVSTDLLGEYVKIPDHGDAGWIRAVFADESHIFVLVQRDNVSKDFKTYFAAEMVMPEVK